jgi:hypothetical protein
MASYMQRRAANDLSPVKQLAAGKKRELCIPKRKANEHPGHSNAEVFFFSQT